MKLRTGYFDFCFKTESVIIFYDVQFVTSSNLYTLEFRFIGQISIITDCHESLKEDTVITSKFTYRNFKDEYVIDILK